MGLANEASPFPWMASESDVLRNVLGQHSVSARHGDDFDPYNLFEKNRDHASLSDAVCVELVKRIGVEIRSELQGQLPDEFFGDLDEMGSIRPELMIPVWIANLLDRYQATRAQREKIDDIWHDLVERFSRLDFLGELDKPFAFDLVDAIRAVLMFARLISIDKLDDWTLAIDQLERRMGLGGRANDSYRKYAAQEDAFRSREVRYIVYGHTHRFSMTPLRSTLKDGMPFNQLYLNAGTWLPVHETCDAEANKKGFIFYKQMGYLGIFKDDERRGKSYEAWNGTLEI
jgi:hypothetical protein